MLDEDLSHNAIPLSGVWELVEGSLTLVEGESGTSVTSELLPSFQNKIFFFFPEGGDSEDLADDLLDSELVENVRLRLRVLVWLRVHRYGSAVPLSLDSELWSLACELCARRTNCALLRAISSTMGLVCCSFLFLFLPEIVKWI